MHILMNMMSLMSLGSSLVNCIIFLSSSFIGVAVWNSSNDVYCIDICYIDERYLRFFFMVIHLCIFIVIRALYAITNSRSWLFSSAVGFSGVLFHFAVLESYHTRIPVRSVFGFCNVPSKIYPWVLLVLLQVMLPNISFIGHLSGILVGILQVFGFIDRMYCFPSIARLRAIEDSEMIVCCTRRNNFVKSPLDRTLALSDTSSSCNWISTNVGRLMPSFGSSGASRDVEMNTRREANDNDENDDADSRPLLTSAPPTTTSIHEEKSGVNQAMRESWLKKYPETEGKG